MKQSADIRKCKILVHVWLFSIEFEEMQDISIHLCSSSMMIEVQISWNPRP